MLIQLNILGILKVLFWTVVAFIESSSGAPLLTCIILLVVAEQQPVWFQASLMLVASIVIATLYTVPVTIAAAVYVAGLFFLDQGAGAVHQRELRLAVAGVAGSSVVAWQAGTAWSFSLVLYYVLVIAAGALVAYRSSKHRVRHQLKLTRALK